MGADYAFNSTKVDVIKEVRKVCFQGVDYTLDAVGVNTLIPDAMRLIKRGGKMLVYGISPVLSMEFDWSKAPDNWLMEFFWAPDKILEAAVHDQLVRWVDMGLINPHDFVSHVLDYADIGKGFEILENKKPAKKIVIKAP